MVADIEARVAAALSGAAEAQRLAEEAGLVYVTDRAPGYRRDIICKGLPASPGAAAIAWPASIGSSGSRSSCAR